MLRGVPLPPRGSARDVYLQQALLQEHDAEMERLNVSVTSVLATAASSDGRTQLLTQMQDALSRLFNLKFPYNKQKAATSADKTKSDLAVLQKVMAAYKPSAQPQQSKES